MVVRYIEMYRVPQNYVMNPPPSRGGDLELEAGVYVILKILRRTWNTYLVWRLNVIVR